jgi:hypothetical protein
VLYSEPSGKCLARDVEKNVSKIDVGQKNNDLSGTSPDNIQSMSGAVSSVFGISKLPLLPEELCESGVGSLR